VTEGSSRAILAAFLADLGTATAKFVAFLFTGAASMLAEVLGSDTGWWSRAGQQMTFSDAL
jgi:divalent metal cation (Fe/Co/Zn/Cd) transporter